MSLVSQVTSVEAGQESSRTAVYSQEQGAVMQSLAALPHNALVAGNNLGAIHFFRMEGAAIVNTVILQASMCAPAKTHLRVANIIAQDVTPP